MKRTDILINSFHFGWPKAIFCLMCPKPKFPFHSILPLLDLLRLPTFFLTPGARPVSSYGHLLSPALPYSVSCRVQVVHPQQNLSLLLPFLAHRSNPHPHSHSGHCHTIAVSIHWWHSAYCYPTSEILARVLFLKWGQRLVVNMKEWTPVFISTPSHPKPL